MWFIFQGMGILIDSFIKNFMGWMGSLGENREREIEREQSAVPKYPLDFP